MSATRATYDVTTWDTDLQDFTPQRGVRRGPYTLFGLRKALRALQQMGYDVSRGGGIAVLVVRRDERTERAKAKGGVAYEAVARI